MEARLKEFTDLSSLDEALVQDIEQAITTYEYLAKRYKSKGAPSAKLKEAAKKLTGEIQQWKQLASPDSARTHWIDTSEEDDEILVQLHDAIANKDADRMKELLDDLKKKWTIDGPDEEAIFEPEEGVEQLPVIDFKAAFTGKTQKPVPPPVHAAAMQQYVIPFIPPFPTEAELEQIKAERAAAEDMEENMEEDMEEAVEGSGGNEQADELAVTTTVRPWSSQRQLAGQAADEDEGEEDEGDEWDGFDEWD